MNRQQQGIVRGCEFTSQFGQQGQCHAVLLFLGSVIGVADAGDLAQASVKSLAHGRRRPVHVYLVCPAKHLADDALVHGRIGRHHAGRIQ